jgi:hypothetical protein
MKSKIESSLVELGYNLQDFGNHWRSNAVYRNGNNPSSLMIYKDTGVWRDFVQNKNPMPFKKLVELTLNTTDVSVLRRYIDIDVNEQTFTIKKEKLEMEKIYPNDCLKKLFPNYSFYSKRKISEDTQKLYKCGLASSGKMYRRIVFPVFNQDSQIYGFSGRKIDEETESPKWKHIGKKNNWIYPSYIPDFPQIEDEVILVESIGDSMALTENGLPNNLVTFGLDCSSSLLNFLVSKDLKQIIIATNNDSNSEINRGLVASIKILIKLSSYFDLNILKIKLPLENDFSDMQKNQINFSEWKSKDYMNMHDIVKFIEENPSEFNKDKVGKFLKKCQNE